MIPLKKIVIGLLCLSFVLTFILSITSTVQQCSIISPPATTVGNREQGSSSLSDVEPWEPYAGDEGGGSRPGAIFLSDGIVCSGDPGGGSRPGGRISTSE